MKINEVKFSRDILIEPVSDRWYRIPGAFTIDLTTDCGRIRINIDDGFMFDGRSGGPAVDFIAPNLGTQSELKAWLLHDINGYGKCLSFEETNELLYSMLRGQCNYSWFRAKVIYTAVSFSDSWYGEPKPTDRERINWNKIHIRHYDK